MANPISRFLSLIFRSKDLVTLNGLVALGTMGGQELFYLLAVQCPCERVQNCQYGLMATCGPPNCSSSSASSSTTKPGTWWTGAGASGPRNAQASYILSWAAQAVAPLTWLVISLLRGDAYVCAFSEFVDPSSLTAENESFPLSHTTQILARFPCRESPDNLSGFREEVSRRLKFESQLLGWLLICTVAMVVFLIKCLKACCSRLGYHQEDYRARYLAKEEQLLRRTAEVHSLALAANNVNKFFGFVAFDEREKELMAKFPKQGTQLIVPWEKITGSSQYQEMLGIPVYSRLHKWANRQFLIDKDFNMTLLPHPQPQLAASPTSTIEAPPFLPNHWLWRKNEV